MARGGVVGRGTREEDQSRARKDASGERPPLPRYGPPLPAPTVPETPPGQGAARGENASGENASVAPTASRFPTVPPRPAPSTQSAHALAHTTPRPEASADPRRAPATVSLDPPGLQRAPRSIPLAALAEPTEAPPPWSSPRWPTNPPSWRTSLPPSSAWDEEERDDLEYVDPLPSEARFHLPAGLLWCLGALLVVSLGRVLLYHGDWADGVLMAAMVAGGLAVVIAIGVALGSLRARRFHPRAALLVALLIATALVCASDGAQADLHLWQASFAKHTSQWSQALAELDASGANPTWLAGQRVEVRLAWGRAALATNDATTAVAQFVAVLADPGATTAQRAQATNGELAAYEQWIAAGGNGLNYVSAIAFLDQYAAHAGCDAACLSGVIAAEAGAYYEYGMLLARQGNESDALTMLTAVGTRFPKSAVATRAHAAAAVVLADEVQQNQSASCPAAVPYLQQLASGYADTPQGAQAMSTLTAPVLVHGTITGMPAPHAAQVALVPLAQAQQGNDTPAYQVQADAFGNFTFLAVTPGTYVLAVDEPGWGHIAWSSPATDVNVAPLCALMLGSYVFP